MDSDFLLIRKMKRGENEAFDVFVRKYYGEILAYLGYRCPDRTCAEDLTQETFVRFFSRLPGYRYQGKTKNYLYTIAGNLCKDYFKKKKEIPIDDVKLGEQAGSTECPMDAVSDKLMIEWALRKLPETLLEVAVLYYFQERKLLEIAQILDISLPLVKYRLRQARQQLGELLRKEKNDESGRASHGA